MRFFTTLGMELTWLYHRKSEVENERMYSYANSLGAEFKESKFPCEGIMTDDSALEINTPPFSDLETLRFWYFGLLEKLAVFPLVSHREDTTSGGGHIHAAIPKHIKKNPGHLLVFLVNLFRDVTNRPYLNWIFNEPESKKSAENLVRLRKAMNALNSPGSFQDRRDKRFFGLVFGGAAESEIKGMDLNEIVHTFDCNKGYAIRVDSECGSKPHTIEFRFFDAKKSFRDIELHVKFVDAYLQYIDRMTTKGVVVRSKVKELGDIQRLAYKDRGLTQFQTFLPELGLRYGDFTDFVENNYRRRKAARLLR